MFIVAHCFLKNARINKIPIVFDYDGFNVSISSTKKEDEHELILQIKQPIQPSNLMTQTEEKDEQGKFIENRLRPYKEKLHEIATLIEGLLQINYIVVMPRFESNKVIVNVYPETREEKKMIDDGQVSGGFGDIITQPKYPLFQWNDQLLSHIQKAQSNLPALSFIAQAIRSQDKKDQEISFFLYFRIIEGYFGDGTANLERALLAKSSNLQKYLPHDEKLIGAIQSILLILKLPSKAAKDYSGLISDLVVIRHKMTHFDSGHSEKHYNPSLKFEMDSLNSSLRWACIKIIRDKIS